MSALLVLLVSFLLSQAVDLLVVLHSFLPPGSRIERVTVYPSDFGLERMREEQERGPQMIFSQRKDGVAANQGKKGKQELRRGLEESEDEDTDADEGVEGSEESEEDAEEEEEEDGEEEAGEEDENTVVRGKRDHKVNQGSSKVTLVQGNSNDDSNDDSSDDGSEEGNQSGDGNSGSEEEGEDEEEDDEDEGEEEGEHEGEDGRVDEGEEDDGAVNEAKLREYERSKLRYFFAVVECDSAATANALYESCDGAEFEHSANKFDLRFIPDGMGFGDRRARDHCTEVREDDPIPAISVTICNVIAISLFSSAHTQRTVNPRFGGRNAMNCCTEVREDDPLNSSRIRHRLSCTEGD